VPNFIVKNNVLLNYGRRNFYAILMGCIPRKVYRQHDILELVIP
jgi:hypothetical protein